MKLRNIVSIFLAVLMFVSLAMGITMLMVNKIVEDVPSLGIRIVDNEYNKKMYESVYKSLENKMALVAIKPEDISDVLTEEIIKNNTMDAVVSVMNQIFSGDNADWEFKDENLREKIDALLKEYAASAGIEYEDGSSDKVYDMVCDTVTSELRIIPQSYLSKLEPIAKKIQSVCSYWIFPLILYAVCAGGILFLDRKNIKGAVYNAVLPSYFAMFTVFAGSALLYSKDYLAKTVLSDGMFQYFIRQVYNTVLYDIRQVSLILTILFLVMAVVIIIALAAKKRHHKHHRGHHSKRRSELTASDHE